MCDDACVMCVCADVHVWCVCADVHVWLCVCVVSMATCTKCSKLRPIPMILSKYILRLFIDHYEVYTCSTDSELLLSMITISCGVRGIAEDVHYLEYRSYNASYIASPNQTHSHMTEPHYEFVLAYYSFSHYIKKKEKKKEKTNLVRTPVR